MIWYQAATAAAIGLVVLILLAFSVRIANEYERGVVFRLGRLVGKRGPGLFSSCPSSSGRCWSSCASSPPMSKSRKPSPRITCPSRSMPLLVWHRRPGQIGRSHLERLQSRDANLADDAAQYYWPPYAGRRAEREGQARGGDAQGHRRCDRALGVQVQMVEMKDVVIPESMQRAMAQEAEALREKRARIIKAEAEMEAAQRLRDAAKIIMDYPAGLELRRMQMITEVGAEQNSMTVVMMPSEFVQRRVHSRK